jgi:alpha-tubulin suppressor-like RCC1 family protein
MVRKNGQGLVRRLWAFGVVVAVLLAGLSIEGSAARADASGAPAGVRRALSARMDAGDDQACVIRDDGSVVCWGYNANGELGVGDIATRGDDPGELPTSAVPLGAGRTATAITAGFAHTCALLDNGSVVCWGYNGNGQLGVGDTTDRGDDPGELPTTAVPLGAGRTATAITAGSAHTCALLDNATVTCWGYNGNGQLGVGDTATRGDNPGELPTTAVPLGAGRTATAISAGIFHTCALLDNATVTCWGYNAGGQLGVGDTATRGDNPGELPTTAVPLGAGRTATAISAGIFHTCVVRDDASVVCWGYNAGGQLGVGDTANRGDNPGELPAPAVPLGAGRAASTITGGSLHSCAVRDDASLVCWGYNGNGQLGVGDTANRGDNPGELPAPPVALGAARSATDVTAGEYHTCAVRDNGTVVCWGYNELGQLGVGDTADRGDGPGELPAPAVPLGGTIRTPAFSAANVAVTEGTGGTKTLTFTLSRTSVVGTVSVAYATIAGTAKAGSDYTATSGRKTLAGGVRRAAIAVPLKTDPDREPNETFVLRLSAPIGATIADANATGTIRNDDAPPAISLADAVITEGDSGTRNVAVRVNLNHRSYQRITVTYATADGSATAPSDYATRNGTLTIAANAAGGTITIPVKGDTRNESNETFHLAANAVTKASLADPLSSIVILDDD